MSLLLYGSPLSPFVRKVEIVLREKQVDFDFENVGMPLPDWFKEISPARRMPVLRDRSLGETGPSGTLPDSSAICAFLEKRNPEPAVYPRDPFEHGRAVWNEEYADSNLAANTGLGVFRPIMFERRAGREPDLVTAKETWTKKLPRNFDYLEGELGEREFFVGDSLSVADIAVACQMHQLQLVAGLPDAARWPRLVDFVLRLAKRPSFEPSLTICRKIVKEPVDLDT